VKPASGVASFIAREIQLVSANSWPVKDVSWDWIVRSFLFMGRHDRALAVLETLENGTPWREQVKTALKAHAAKEFRKSAEAWQQCSALEPTWFYPHYELAHGFLALGEPGKAITHAERANKLHPPYHNLWHKVPMEIVIMTALRKTGRGDLARERLKTLETRGLVDIVPELRIEAAAQHDTSEDGNRQAEQCLADAVRLLKDYPIDEACDRHIMQRIITQYVRVATRHIELNHDDEALPYLRNAANLARKDPALRDHSILRLIELAEERAKCRDYSLARKCCAILPEFATADPWCRLLIARLHILVGDYAAAVHQLYTITRIPEATRSVVEEALSPASTARLAPCWPESPKAIRKPLKLLLLGFRICVRPGVILRSEHIRDARLLLLLIWIYATRHLIHRLRGEITMFRRLC
jgi:tetratricopeptide (TPR) repeat protein